MQTAMGSGADVYVRQQKLQLFEGIGSDKRAITPFYRPKTIVIKQQKGQPWNRVTLKDTGAFYNGIYADPQGDKMFIDSRDSKSNALQEKYGDTVLGLGGTFRYPYIEVVEMNMIDSVKQILKL